MKEKETYKEQIDREIHDLIYSALELADIIDQPINEHGMITVNYQFASEIIHRAQQSAKTVGNELSWIVSGLADLTEIYPEVKRVEP